MAGAIDYNAMNLGRSVWLGGGSYMNVQQAAPNWNANDGAFKDLYPGVETLSEGMWGFKGEEETARLNQEWFADQKKQAPSRSYAPGAGFGMGLWGGQGGAATANGRGFAGGFSSGWAGSGVGASLGVKGF
jgi:hypothetical protein